MHNMCASQTRRVYCLLSTDSDTDIRLYHRRRTDMPSLQYISISFILSIKNNIKSFSSRSICISRYQGDMQNIKLEKARITLHHWYSSLIGHGDMSIEIKKKSINYFFFQLNNVEDSFSVKMYHLYVYMYITVFNRIFSKLFLLKSFQHVFVTTQKKINFTKQLKIRISICIQGA